MRFWLVALCCMAPTLAMAQERIPDAALRTVYDNCLPVCQEEHTYAFCSEICACATDELSRNWSLSELRDRGAELSVGGGGAETRARMTRLAAFCADQAQQR